LSISDQERVEDILEFAQTLASLVEKGQDKFRSEVVLQLSIERLMISIGEACSKLSNEFQSAHPQIHGLAPMELSTWALESQISRTQARTLATNSRLLSCITLFGFQIM